MLFFAPILYLVTKNFVYFMLFIYIRVCFCAIFFFFFLGEKKREYYSVALRFDSREKSPQKKISFVGSCLPDFLFLAALLVLTARENSSIVVD